MAIPRSPYLDLRWNRGEANRPPRVRPTVRLSQGSTVEGRPSPLRSASGRDHRAHLQSFPISSDLLFCTSPHSFRDASELGGRVSTPNCNLSRPECLLLTSSTSFFFHPGSLHSGGDSHAPSQSIDPLHRKFSKFSKFSPPAPTQVHSPLLTWPSRSSGPPTVCDAPVPSLPPPPLGENQTACDLASNHAPESPSRDSDDSLTRDWTPRSRLLAGRFPAFLHDRPATTCHLSLRRPRKKIGRPVKAGSAASERRTSKRRAIPEVLSHRQLTHKSSHPTFSLSLSLSLSRSLSPSLDLSVHPPGQPQTSAFPPL